MNQLLVIQLYLNYYQLIQTNDHKLVYQGIFVQEIHQVLLHN